MVPQNIQSELLNHAAYSKFYLHTGQWALFLLEVQAYDDCFNSWWAAGPGMFGGAR